MIELYSSLYQSIQFFPEYALLKRVLHSHPEDMDRNDFRHEWLEYAKAIRSHQPQHILVNASRFNFLIVGELQQWINENIISVFNEVGLKKWALVFPPQFLQQVSIEQTIEANPKNNFAIHYFETEEEAMHWLLEK